MRLAGRQASGVQDDFEHDADPIYLDHNATTPVDPRVLEAMLPYFTRIFGNAASHTHAYGWRAEAGVDDARSVVASLLDVSPTEVVFTSGATEANNLALTGVMNARREPGHLITVATEHKAVLDTAAALQRAGHAVTILPVDPEGRVSPGAVLAALRSDTRLVSVMHGNNEIGTVQPIAALAALCHERGILLHTDAAQTVGKLPMTAPSLGADLISFSGHKLYGPKGIGALIVRSESRHLISAIQHGGGHEWGLRSGTLPVPLVVGLAAALRVAEQDLEDEGARLARLRDQLWAGIAGLPEVYLNGPLPGPERLPHNLNVSVGYVEPDAMLMAMPDLAVSTGSACTSDSQEPSYVLSAIGRQGMLAKAAVRFGLGRMTTDAHVTTAIASFRSAVERLRSMSPLWADRRV